MVTTTMGLPAGGTTGRARAAHVRPGAFPVVGVLALVVAGMLVAALGAGPSRGDGGALPPCAVADTPADRRGYDDWAATILDTGASLGPDYVPPDLVPAPGGDGRPGRALRVRAFVAPRLRLLVDAARRAGVTVAVTSAYRSYDDQRGTFDSLARAYGTGFALASAARPGHSEHQLGTTVDIAGDTDWLAANAWHHGFVMSYPPGRSPAMTCYKPEVWHYRYLGRQRAAAIHASGLSPREWLWAHAGP